MNELDILRDRLVDERNKNTESMLQGINKPNEQWYCGVDRGLCTALMLIADIKADREKNQESHLDSPSLL